MVEQPRIGGEVRARGAADRLWSTSISRLMLSILADDLTLGGTGGTVLERGFGILLLLDRRRCAKSFADQLNKRLAD